ncbi:glycoside hydrolase family 27 protein [Alloacidobacterium dinghuense]|uniref:Alpha-galactosidase n=1 Tax=Alloacidobacterium dinghuense TaxID=2763107 RepID=A0A7G8BN61_9BACT|nr:glycoside hydrolase family 27 protein [Alloacidobacterium dinghuense]QNI33981.1 glycoside hydrolase family 27 protein [Alloacidobacterium dinghuense]
MKTSFRSCVLGSVFLAAFALNAQSSSPILASSPPLGWNSWDSYGLTITEDQFRANVQWFNQHLKQYGWQYVVIDEGWYLQHPENASTKGAGQGYTMDSNGRYLPAPNRFPSSANGEGLKTVADYVHSLGLKFGIHIIRGIPKKAVEKNLPIAGSQFHAADAADTSDLCSWNPDNYGLKPNAAGQAYYNSLAKLYAGWGLDFIKVDCISQPYNANEIHMMSAALKESGRPIVFSLSPGPTPITQAGDVRKYAQLWRISDDFWDVWKKPESDTQDFPQSLTRQFGKLAQWSPHVETGHWPDADMLPLGYLGPIPGWGEPRHSRFSTDEARTLITLWSIARSPLILGANLTQMDELTESLLTNTEVIVVDQHSSENKPTIQTETAVVWTAKGAAGKRYVALFNIGESQQTLSYGWKQLGLSGSSYKVRDLWQKKDLGSAATLQVVLAPHASALYAVD